MEDEFEELQAIRIAEQLNGKMFSTRVTLKLAEIIRKAKEEGFVEGQKKTLGDLLLRECPVKYFNGTQGNAVPSEVIKKKLEELG
jgi:hypothetical protein